MTNEKDPSRTTKDVATVEVTRYLKALRKGVGRQIDPETAEVDWTYAQTLDPYGDHLDLPEEYQQVGREYFARSPSVWIADLPTPFVLRTRTDTVATQKRTDAEADVRVDAPVASNYQWIGPSE